MKTYPSELQARLLASCSQHGCEECVELGANGFCVNPDEWDRNECFGEFVVKLYKSIEKRNNLISMMRTCMYDYRRNVYDEDRDRVDMLITEADRLSLGKEE